MAAGLGGEEREVCISIKPFLCSIGQGKKDISKTEAV